MVDALSSTQATLSSTVGALSFSVGNLSSTQATHSAMLACDHTSRRRMADDEPQTTEEPPLPSARAIVAKYLQHNPDEVSPLDDAQRTHLKAVMERFLENFGQPAPP